jgi:hypothetical protein
MTTHGVVIIKVLMAKARHRYLKYVAVDNCTSRPASFHGGA